MTVCSRIASVVAILALSVTPVAASAATGKAVNVSSLSIAHGSTAPLGGARVGATRGKESKLFGIPVVLAALIGVAVVATVVVVADNNNNSTSP